MYFIYMYAKFPLITTLYLLRRLSLILLEFSMLYTVFMLIERMIQLLQENSIPGIVCILLERKPLPAIIFYESN